VTGVETCALPISENQRVDSLASAYDSERFTFYENRGNFPACEAFGNVRRRCLQQQAQEFLDLVSRPEVADAPYFPLQPNAGLFQHPGSHCLAKIFEFVSRRRAGVDHEVAMQG